MSIYFKIKKALDHFTLDLDYGFDSGLLVIRGESGAGKTTILNCISGIDNPDGGEICMNGEVLYRKDNTARYENNKKVHLADKTEYRKNTINVPARNRRVAYLFQNYALFPNMTVEKNIFYGMKNLKEYKSGGLKSELVEYARSIMGTFHISHLKDKNPKNISGGERQRVALARAMVTKPSLLLLDEPFSALDESTKSIVYREFENFKETFEIPTILITHSSQEAERFGDNIIQIKEGKLI